MTVYAETHTHTSLDRSSVKLLSFDSVCVLENTFAALTVSQSLHYFSKHAHTYIWVNSMPYKNSHTKHTNLIIKYLPPTLFIAMSLHVSNEEQYQLPMKIMQKLNELQVYLINSMSITTD